MLSSSIAIICPFRTTFPSHLYQMHTMTVRCHYKKFNQNFFKYDFHTYQVPLIKFSFSPYRNSYPTSMILHFHNILALVVVGIDLPYGFRLLPCPRLIFLQFSILHTTKHIVSFPCTLYFHCTVRVAHHVILNLCVLTIASLLFVNHMKWNESIIPHMCIILAY
jgi:hypothetical protein